MESDGKTVSRRATLNSEEAAGDGNVDVTLGYVGAPPPSYPINTIYLWTSGQHEAVLRVALNPDSHIRVDEFEERLRKTLPENFQDASSLLKRETS